MLEDLDAIVMCELLARWVQMWLPELAACHDETCKQEGRCRPDIVHSMQNGVKQANERIQPEEESIKPK